jgi:heme-degrading monooxygenase HmoA
MAASKKPASVEPGCLAVIFTSRRPDRLGERGSDDGYEQTADRMVELAAAQPGFLGVESARGADGLGITVSYWRDEDSIRAWREHAEHVVARRHGREAWYEWFAVRVARIERAYSS